MSDLSTNTAGVPMPPSRVGTVLLASLAMLLAGCGSASPSRSQPVQSVQSPPARASGGRPAHVAVIVMENEEYTDIIGSRSAPYINGLARRYGLATETYAISHPSLPNYLALAGGSTFGITSDCIDCSVPGAGLAGQLEAAHISWKGYMEDLPRPCFTGSDSGNYAKKHDPFVYFRPLVANASLCARRVVPLPQLAADERSGSLPSLIWITPNLCHDMHDCDVGTGDRFLSGLVAPLIRLLGKRGLLIVTWDEGSSDAGCCRLASGGHVVTIVAGPAARLHARLATATDHYSVLRTIEDLFGVERLGGAACACTPSLQPLLR
jgi:hypothetical protein